MNSMENEEKGTYTEREKDKTEKRNKVSQFESSKLNIMHAHLIQIASNESKSLARQYI